MKTRPLTVTVLAWLLILTGVVAAGFHLSGAAKDINEVWIALVQLAAVIAGIFLLRGQNWARWLALAWMAFHVAISIKEPVEQLVVHSLLLFVFAYLLYRRDARAYFDCAPA